MKFLSDDSVSLYVKVLFYVAISFVTYLFTVCFLSLLSSADRKYYKLLFKHFINLISFHRHTKTWRKRIETFVAKKETIETYTTYTVENLGSGVHEKTLEKSLLQKVESDVIISLHVDSKDTSQRKALIQVPYHCRKSCDLMSRNNIKIDDRKILIKEIKKRKHLLQKDFKLVSPKPSVISTGERHCDNEAWKIGSHSEYLLIDGGNSIMDIDKRFLKSVLENSDEAGIQRMVLTCTNLKETKQAVKLCERYPGYMYFTAGVQPSYIDQWKEGSLAGLEKYAEHPQCVAIGECGLSGTGSDKQEEIFRQQIELACKMRKPLWFCSVKADDRLIPILEEYKDRLTGMCVGEYEPMGRKIFPHVIPRLWELLQMGSYVSVSSWSMASGGYVMNWFTDLLEKGYISPYNVIFTSTAPDTEVPNLDFEDLCDKLTPRGMKYLQESTVDKYYINSSEDMGGEPSCLPVLLEIISSHLDCPPQKLASITTNNAQTFFNFK